MVGLDSSNSDASRARDGRGDVNLERFYPFRVYIQHVNNQIRGFFWICDRLAFYLQCSCGHGVLEQYIGPLAHFDERLV